MIKSVLPILRRQPQPRSNQTARSEFSRALTLNVAWKCNDDYVDDDVVSYIVHDCILPLIDFFLQSVMLVIAWKLQAATMGFFTFHEWSKGMLSIE